MVVMIESDVKERDRRRDGTTEVLRAIDRDVGTELG